jgi:hypothetical protein
MGEDLSIDKRREALGAWVTDHGFGLLDDRDQEAERLPLFVIQATVDRDVHNVSLGLWEDTEVALFDLRRGREPNRVDSTGATLAFSYGLPTTLIGHRDVPEEQMPLSAMPAITEHPLGIAYEVRGRDHGFVEALLVDPLAAWLIAWAESPPPMSYELSPSWLLGYSGLLEPEDIPELLDGVLGFRDRIPGDVVTRFGR